MTLQKDAERNEAKYLHAFADCRQRRGHDLAATTLAADVRARPLSTAHRRKQLLLRTASQHLPLKRTFDIAAHGHSMVTPTARFMPDETGVLGWFGSSAH
jgi:hypothetical protein